MRRSVVLGPLVFRAALVWTVSLASAQGGIVVDQSPSHLGGTVSDTAFDPSAGTTPQWMRVADNITLDAAATIRHLTWWGFYSANAVPSQQETIRARFYAARASDGLPGNAFFDVDFASPIRTPTGVSIPGVPPGTGGTALEYQFDVDLPFPLSLSANTSYWLEIAQLELPASEFQWEGAASKQQSIAIISSSNPDWTLADSWARDMAFQLSTIPEPATLVLILAGLVPLAGNRLRAR